MNWRVVKIKESDFLILIGFSKDESLNGRIEFDKRTNKYKVVSLSKDCDDFDVNWLMGHLQILIKQDKLSLKPYRISIG